MLHCGEVRVRPRGHGHTHSSASTSTHQHTGASSKNIQNFMTLFHALTCQHFIVITTLHACKGPVSTVSNECVRGSGPWP